MFYWSHTFSNNNAKEQRFRVECESISTPTKKNFLQYFHSGYQYFREILPVCYQFTSTPIYQFRSIYLNINKMALIFLGLPIVFNVFSFKFHQVRSP